MLFNYTEPIPVSQHYDMEKNPAYFSAGQGTV